MFAFDKCELISKCHLMLGPHIIFLTFEVEKSASLKTIYIIHLKKKNRKINIPTYMYCENGHIKSCKEIFQVPIIILFSNICIYIYRGTSISMPGRPLETFLPE